MVVREGGCEGVGDWCGSERRAGEGGWLGEQ